MEWTINGIYAAAKARAEEQHDELDIKHFWALADEQWPGAAPTTLLRADDPINSLEERARQYRVLDACIDKYATNRDEMNVAASIRRTQIYREQKAAGFCETSESTLRMTCRANLMFLAREMFDKYFVHATHAQICNFFVQKNNLQRIEAQSDMKGRLLLFGRGAGKSTMDMIDCVQWIINWCDIEIMVLTGVKDLAKDFVEETKGYFLLDKDAEQTNFQRLFREYIIPNSVREKGKETVLTVPKTALDFYGKSRGRNKTLWASSILSSDTGKHCLIIKGDDTVHEKNVEKPELIIKVKKKIEKAENLLMPGGYIDLIGTPYAGNDLYATKLDYAVKHPESRLVLRVPSLIRRPEAEYKMESDCTEQDFFVTFPKDKYGNDKLTFQFLWGLRDEKPEDFRSQQMLDPHGVKKVQFTRELLGSRTVTYSQMPQNMMHYIFCDFAFTATKTSDYTVIAVIGMDWEGRGYVIDVWRDRDATGTEISRALAKFNHEYKPRLISIENANGAQNLRDSIIRAAEVHGDHRTIPLDFFTPERTKDAKESRIFALEPLLQQGRLLFLDQISCLQDLYDEFQHYGTALHDDIPDAISMFLRVLPQNATHSAISPDEAARIMDLKMKNADLERMIFEGPQEAPLSEPEVEISTQDDGIVDYGFGFNPNKLK